MVSNVRSIAFRFDLFGEIQGDDGTRWYAGSGLKEIVLFGPFRPTWFHRHGIETRGL
jgi:hypothetical protein